MISAKKGEKKRKKDTFYQESPGPPVPKLKYAIKTKADKATRALSPLRNEQERSENDGRDDGHDRKKIGETTAGSRFRYA